MQNSNISDEQMAHIKFQVKNDILNALNADLNEIKLKLNDLEERFQNSLNAVPQMIKDNVALIVEDYQYLKNYNCLCFKRK